MPRRATVLASLVVLATACQTTVSTTTTISGTPTVQPAPVPAFDPAGKWILGLVAQGQAMQVVVELVKLPDGSYGGTFANDAFPTISITTGTLTGKQLLLTYPIPGGNGASGSMTLNFNGETVEGEWSMPGDGSKVSGKKG